MENMVPSFLIAPPHLTDPHFRDAVVALTTHERGGAMGFIISRPTNVTLYELLDNLGISPKVPDQQVLYGGPQAKNTGFVVYEHKRRKQITPSFFLSDTISISPSKDVLEKAAKGKLGRFELILGYSGWETGQLDTELEQGDWLHTPFCAEIVFDVPHEKRWRRSYEHLGVSPFAFMRVPGGAQA